MGGIAAHGVGNLYKTEGILEQYQYHQTTRNQLVPSARKLFSSKSWTFQKDSDPKHTTKSAKALYSQLHVPREEWPANSPDLNPTDNLWQYLVPRCYVQGPQVQHQGRAVCSAPGGPAGTHP